MNVLSLFDGMSCGQIALERAGIKVDNYFASEIDKYAIIVAKSNFPNINHIGSVIDVDVKKLPKIDLLIGGSPCQSFSFAGTRKGMTTKCTTKILTLDDYLFWKEQNFEFEGQSYLFWEYIRILKDLIELNPNIKFLLENVMMEEEWKKLISKTIGVNPISINSALLSAQNRERLYWTNIGMVKGGLFGDLVSIIQQPKDKGLLLKDILEKEVDVKYFLSEKALTFFTNNTIKMKAKGNGFCFEPTDGYKKGKGLTTRNGSRMDDNFIKVDTLIDFSHRNEGVRYYEDKSPTLNARDYKQPRCIKTKTSIRKLTPIECERLQTVPDNYTNYVSDTQRYKMLGNGWTIDVIAYILNYMK